MGAMTARPFAPNPNLGPSPNLYPNLNPNLNPSLTLTLRPQASPSPSLTLAQAVAIGIHNFPEGLATFLATVANTSSGASLGVAIAIHNIPEGLCVAMPIYYATGNKWKVTLTRTLTPNPNP